MPVAHRGYNGASATLIRSKKTESRRPRVCVRVVLTYHAVRGLTYQSCWRLQISLFGRHVLARAIWSRAIHYPTASLVDEQVAFFTTRLSRVSSDLPR